MDVYETAAGDCAVCGANTDGSRYWTPLPEEIWLAIRPHLLAFFGDLDRIQNVLFVPDHSKPFCGAKCSLTYHNEHGF